MDSSLSLYKRSLTTYLPLHEKTISSKRKLQLAELQKILGVEFKRVALLDKALSHPSYVNSFSSKNLKLRSNQRLEFFGDAVLGFVISEQLFSTYVDFDEGFLSKIRAAAVSRRILVKIAKNLHLNNFLRLGKGEKKAGTQNISSVLEDVVEAIIGAIYIDAGLVCVRRFILRHFKDEIEEIILSLDNLNYKSRLQEFIQREHKATPTYKVDKTEGPEHKIRFYVSVHLNGKLLGKGDGYSKKAAESICARNALEKNYRENTIEK